MHLFQSLLGRSRCSPHCPWMAGTPVARLPPACPKLGLESSAPSVHARDNQVHLPTCPQACISVPPWASPAQNSPRHLPGLCWGGEHTKANESGGCDGHLLWHPGREASPAWGRYCSLSRLVPSEVGGSTALSSQKTLKGARKTLRRCPGSS